MLQIPDTSKIPFLATFYKFPSQNNLDPAQLTAQNLLFSNCYSTAALPDPDQRRLVCYAPPLEAQVHGVAGPPALFVRRRLVIYFFFLFKIFPRRSNSLELERSENFLCAYGTSKVSIKNLSVRTAWKFRHKNLLRF